MYEFGFLEYLILISSLLFCILFIINFSKNVKNKNDYWGLLSKKWTGPASLILGTIMVPGSIVFHNSLKADVYHTPELLRPIILMTSVPLFLFSFITIMFGLTFIYVGILILNKRKNI